MTRKPTSLVAHLTVSVVIMVVLWLSVGFLFILLFARSATPHGGGLDAYGCHHDRKAGGYHCHRGPLAGQFFSSKEEMLKKLVAEKAATAKSNEKK